MRGCYKVPKSNQTSSYANFLIKFVFTVAMTVLLNMISVILFLRLLFSVCVSLFSYTHAHGFARVSGRGNIGACIERKLSQVWNSVSYEIIQSDLASLFIHWLHSKRRLQGLNGGEVVTLVHLHISDSGNSLWLLDSYQSWTSSWTTSHC